MIELESYLEGRWVRGKGARGHARQPATEEPLAEPRRPRGSTSRARSRYARERGGPALRALTFARARRAAPRRLARDPRPARRAHRARDRERRQHARRRQVRHRRRDRHARRLRRPRRGARRRARSSPTASPVQLGRTPRLFGQHVLVPRAGVAVHVNAFNFPAWGLAEKAASALLAGMPVVSKPATAHRARRPPHRASSSSRPASSRRARSRSSPAAPGDLLDHLGGAGRARVHRLERHRRATLRGDASVARATRCASTSRPTASTPRCSAPTSSRGIETYGPVPRRRRARHDAEDRPEVHRDPARPRARGALDDVREAPRASGSRAVKVGDPAREEVTMGPLATARSSRRARRHRRSSRRAPKSRLRRRRRGRAGRRRRRARASSSAPVLLAARERRRRATRCTSTRSSARWRRCCPTTATPAEAVALVARGGGGLVSSRLLRRPRLPRATMVLGHRAVPRPARPRLARRSPARRSGPGTVLPQLVHGGPGRAGGGEELGGLRGLALLHAAHRAPGRSRAGGGARRDAAIRAGDAGGAAR